MAINPFAFGVRDIADSRGVLLLISVFTTSFMIPGLGVVLMKPLGLIQSLEMHDKQERTGPFIICGVFYLWLFKNFLTGSVPLIFAQFALAATIALFLAFFANIFTKISVQATGMGTLSSMVLILAFIWPGMTLELGLLQLSLNAVLAGILLLAGLAGYIQLRLGAHAPEDVWRGYAIGAVSVLLAYLLL